MKYQVILHMQKESYGRQDRDQVTYFIIQNTETKYSEFKTSIRICDFKFVILNTDNQWHYGRISQFGRDYEAAQEDCRAKHFALGAGIPQATLSQILNEKQQINVSTINKVIEHYPDLVNPHELLFGEGSAHQESAESGLFPSIGLAETSDKTVDALQATLLAQSEEITRLKSELAQRQAKTIDHITVFFTDNSFMTFHCED